MSLGLPPVSVGLKSIAPYLQRAEELVDREPVIAYWCAYYAAQVGISLKAKDAGSRTLLFDLLGALERLKNEIGPNDAVDSEAASAAYVENFALKVFRMADDEDRAGRATKSTAKKFLAAGNFLEVLRVFPKAEISESQMSAADIARANRDRLRSPGEGKHDDETLSPSQWSTTATPGVDLAESAPGLDASRSLPGSTESVNNWHEHVVDPITRARNSGESGLRQAWVSTEMEGAASDEDVVRDPVLNGGGVKKVRFSPTSPSLRHASPPRVSSSPPRPRAGSVSPSAPPLSDLPPGFVPTGPPVSPERYPYSPLSGASAPPPGVPTFISPVSPLPPPSAPSIIPGIPSVAPPPPPPRLPESFELTPHIIAQAQKHCRFAISALDYEDAQHARKELIAALELLGGAL